MARTSRPHRSLAALALALLGACAGGSPASTGDAGTPFRCAADTDCDDSIACTLDTCSVSGMCTFAPIAERCSMPGQTCVVGRGCVEGRTCASDAECDDAIACTHDACAVGGMCRNTALSERCTDPARPVCDPVAGCVEESGCASDLDCDDAIPCTLDTCLVDRTCDHMPVHERCDPGQTCSAATGCFTPMPCTTAMDCQDGNFCNGAEICMPEFGCQPAAAPRACDDSEACTVDRCDATMDMCVFACDASRPECGCGPPPSACSGRFRLTGATLRYECMPAFAFLCGGAGIELDEVTFVNETVALTATPRMYYTSSAGTRIPMVLTLTDSTDPVCPTFDAVATIEGGCTEEYRITGMFTGTDSFTGRISWTYRNTDPMVDQCSVCGCVSGGSDVTGARVP